MALDSYQADALARVIRGENVLVTGRAGAGKTRFIKAVVAHCEAKKRPLLVTAMTGVAATLLGSGATTLHRALGLGTGTRPLAAIVQSLKWRKAQVTALREAQAVIVDEISMASGEVLDLAAAVLQHYSRTPSVPWGGRQVIFCGDFSQLLPISRGAPAQLAFESDAWRAANLTYCVLRGNHRQSGDSVYRDLLSAVAENRVTEEHLALLRTRVATGEALEAARRTSLVLCGYNADADAFNQARLETLPEDTESTFVATIAVHSRTRPNTPAPLVKAASDFMRASLRVHEALVLRVGARVMLLANIDQDPAAVRKPVANGSCGVVTGYDEKTDAPVVRFDNGRVWTAEPWKWDFRDPEWLGTFSQLPLVLAYATSTHKSQGLTVPRVVLSLSARQMFTAHMAYVALSRVQRLEDITCTVVAREGFSYDTRVLAFQQTLEKKKKTTKMPPTARTEDAAEKRRKTTDV